MSNKVKIPIAESLNVKNAFYISTENEVIIYHYNEAIAVMTRADRKLYLYANKLTQSDTRAIKEIFPTLARVGKFNCYEYFNSISGKNEVARLISELQ